jgi:hypothetical protein
VNLAVQSGAARMIQNQKNGAISRGQRKLDPDVNGMGGEIAVCKYLNSFPDLSVGPHYSGYDLTVNGKKIDVKTTTYNPGYLTAHPKKQVNDCDIYILVYAALPRFTIQGWVTSANLIQDSNLKDTGYGSRYTLESSQLRKIEHLCIQFKQGR